MSQLKPCKHCGGQPVKSMNNKYLFLICPKCHHEVHAPLELIKGGADFPASVALTNLERLCVAKEEVIGNWNEYNEQSDKKMPDSLVNRFATHDITLSRRDQFALTIAKGLFGTITNPLEVPRVAVRLTDELLNRLDETFEEES